MTDTSKKASPKTSKSAIYISPGRSLDLSFSGLKASDEHDILAAFMCEYMPSTMELCLSMAPEFVLQVSAWSPYLSCHLLQSGHKLWISLVINGKLKLYFNNIRKEAGLISDFLNIFGGVVRHKFAPLHDLPVIIFFFLSSAKAIISVLMLLFVVVSMFFSLNSEVKLSCGETRDFDTNSGITEP
jgi:hypothetical protein